MSQSDEISAKVLEDLRSGMSDTDLMKKHKLSYSELRSLFKDLFDSGILLQTQSVSRRTSIKRWSHI